MFRRGFLGLLAQQGFEFGEGLFDWVQVGAVGRQKEEFGAGVADGTPDIRTFMAAQIIHHDDVARPQGWHQCLLNPGQEAAAVDWTFQQTWRGNTIATQAGDEGHGFPMAVRRFCQQALTFRRPATQRRHIRLGPGLINKDQPGRIDFSLVAAPLDAPAGDIRPVLFAGVQAFF